MGERISVADACQMYSGAVCEYLGELVYVSSIDDNYLVLMKELLSNKIKRVKFDTDHFSAPSSGRLGYVNFGVIAMYFRREPKRIYSNGFTSRNISGVVGDFAYSPEELQLVREETSNGITNPAFRDTFSGVFPSFEEAVKKAVTKEARIVAFDRQFAVSYKNGVYYKGTLVGNVDIKRAKKEEDIIWKEEFSSLFRLIGQFKLEA